MVNCNKMIETVRDSHDRVIAFCEWNLVNEKGQFDNQGSHVWVNDLEIHPHYQRNGILRDIISTIAYKAPSAEFVYWKRRKYNSRLRMYSREQIA